MNKNHDEESLDDLKSEQPSGDLSRNILRSALLKRHRLADNYCQVQDGEVERTRQRLVSSKLFGRAKTRALIEALISSIRSLIASHSAGFAVMATIVGIILLGGYEYKTSLIMHQDLSLNNDAFRGYDDAHYRPHFSKELSGHTVQYSSDVRNMAEEWSVELTAVAISFDIQKINPDEYHVYIQLGESISELKDRFKRALEKAPTSGEWLVVIRKS